MIWGDTVYIAGSEAEMANRLLYINFNTGTIDKQVSVMGGGSAGALLFGGVSVDTALKKIFASSNLAGLFAGWETVPGYSAYPSGLYGVNTPPAVLANCVVFGSENNQDTGGCAIHFYNKSNGTALWSFKPSTYKAISGGIAVGNGMVLAGSTDGYLYGFGSGASVTSPVRVDTMNNGTAAQKSGNKKAGEWILTAFPNPASGSGLVFDGVLLSNGAEVSIYAINGTLIKKVSAQKGRLSASWDLKDNRGIRIANGRYHAVVKSKDGKYMKEFKIIVQ
jgi:hypothetical protein